MMRKKDIVFKLEQVEELTMSLCTRSCEIQRAFEKTQDEVVALKKNLAIIFTELEMLRKP